jgi:hypothetical protein
MTYETLAIATLDGLEARAASLGVLTVGSVETIVKATAEQFDSSFNAGVFRAAIVEQLPKYASLDFQ